MDGRSGRHHDHAAHPQQAGGGQVPNGSGECIAFYEVIGVLTDLRRKLREGQVERVQGENTG